MAILAQALTPTSTATEERNGVVERVQAAVRNRGFVVHFGSWVAGLHSPTGDVDMSLDGWLTW